MKPRHELRCLGQPHLVSPNGELIRFRTKKHLALLVYLAIETGRPHRRDRLGELLWPKAELPEARHSLATALSILRPRLPTDALETTRDYVAMRAGQVALDLERLGEKEILSPDTTGLLNVAPFLDGFEIPDAPDFAMWKDGQQGRLLPKLREALVALIDLNRRTGQSRHMEHLADRLLLLDDLNEEAIRAKMEARAWTGDRLTALRVFEDWKSRLQQELQATPSAQLEAMAVRMRRGGWESTAIRDIPVVALDRGRERPFIGRAREYTQLYETWEALRTGRPIHSIVLGDSGVGKTTLVERLTTAASLEGAAVARVQSHDLERNIPFATLVGLILGLLDKPGASATPPEALAELARTVPEVRRRFPTLPPSGDSQGETARIRLTEAFHQLLQAIAEDQPVIMVVDDLHLADEPSLSVVHLALRRSAEEPILAVFTGRQAELGHSAQASLLRQSLARQGGQEIVLAPLDSEQSMDLLVALLQTDDTKASVAVRRSLVSASGGYPMVLELLVQDWRTRGVRSVTIALEGMTADFSNGADPTAVYGHILSHITNALEPRTKAALSLASVLGRRLNDLSLYEVIDLSLGQTMAALGQLLQLHVLRDSGKGLEFANELIRVHAYSAVPSSIRKALHASIADILEHSDGLTEGASGLEIAWHTMRAGRTTEAIPHLMTGARVAMRAGAPQSAEMALSSSLSSLEGDNRLEATLLLVEALQEQGHWQDSLQVLEEFPITQSERAQEAFAMASLAKGYLGSSLSRDLYDLLPTLRSIIRDCPHTLSRVRAARAVAHGVGLFRDRALAREFLALLEDIPRVGLDADAMAQLSLAQAMFLYQAGEAEASFLKTTAALTQLRASGVTNVVAVQLQTGLGAMSSLQGRYEEAATHSEVALEMATRLGNDSLIAVSLANLGLAYIRLGRYEDQLRCTLDSLRAAENRVFRWSDIQSTYCTALAFALSGKPQRARELVAALESRLPTLPSSLTQRWLLWKADIFVVAGPHSQALETGSSAVLDFHLKLESDAFAGVFARWAGITCRGTAFEKEAGKVLSCLEERLEEFDAIDQLEILCANSCFGLQPAGRYSERILAKARVLPAPAVGLIKTMGMISEAELQAFRANL